MEFSKELREDVLSGEITVSFRLWQRRQVSPGRRYRVALGWIEVDSIELVPFSSIDEEDVRRAGETDLEALRRRAAVVMFAASSAVRCMKPLQACGVAASARAAPGMPHARCDQVHTRPLLIWNWTRIPLDQPETVWLVGSIVVTFCGQVTQSSATISSWIRAAISYASTPAARSRSRSSPLRASLTAAGSRAKIAVSELVSALRSALTAPRARAMSRSVPLNRVPVEDNGRSLSSAVIALRTRWRPR